MPVQQNVSLVNAQLTHVLASYSPSQPYTDSSKPYENPYNSNFTFLSPFLCPSLYFFFSFLTLSNLSVYIPTFDPLMHVATMPFPEREGVSYGILIYVLI